MSLNTNLIILALVLVSFTGIYQLESQNQQDKWLQETLQKYNNFKQKFQFKEDNFDYRFSVFVENLKKIEKVNSEKRSYTLGINQFTGYTLDEFVSRGQTLNDQVQPTKSFNSNDEYQTSVGVSKAKDWCEKGFCNPVIDENECVSTYATQPASMYSAYRAINMGGKRDFKSLSGQQIMSCTDIGCGGAYVKIGIEYVVSNGLVTEKEFPYDFDYYEQPDCTYNTNKVLYKPEGYGHYVFQRAEKIYKLVNDYPIIARVVYQSDIIQSYSGGLIDDEYCGEDIQLPLLMVGYDSTHDNKYKAPYFRLQNAWGTSWGVNGFVYIAAKDTTNGGICGVQRELFSPEEH